MQFEHALNEWRDGTQRHTNFKEDAAVRYFHHLAGIECLEKGAPIYTKKLQVDTFKSML